MQQQPQHTAGPWKATQLLHNKDARRWVILAADTSKAGTHHRRLDAAGCFTQADARLIEEAPALLAALKTLVAGPRTSHWDDVCAARTVIARATGQEF